MLQAPEYVRGDQVDEVAVEGQLQQLTLAEEGARLQGRDAVVLKVQVVETAQPRQVLETDLDYSIVLEEDGLEGERETEIRKDHDNEGPSLETQRGSLLFALGFCFWVNKAERAPRSREGQ